jgi:hypothetical protein
MYLSEVSQPLKGDAVKRREMIPSWRKAAIVVLFFVDSLLHGALVFGWRSRVFHYCVVFCNIKLE